MQFTLPENGFDSPTIWGRGGAERLFMQYCSSFFPESAPKFNINVYSIQNNFFFNLFCECIMYDAQHDCNIVQTIKKVNETHLQSFTNLFGNQLIGILRHCGGIPLVA